MFALCSSGKEHIQIYLVSSELIMKTFWLRSVELYPSSATNNALQQSPSWPANRCSPGQQILRFYPNWYFSILFIRFGHKNPVHSLLSCFFNIHFNIIIAVGVGFLDSLFTSDFSTTTQYAFLFIIVHVLSNILIKQHLMQNLHS